MKRIRTGGEAMLEIKNTILSGSFVSPLLIDELSGINVSWSLSDTEELPGSNNLHDDPMFIMPPQSNFELQSGSPCIDAGDPASDPDPDGSIGRYRRLLCSFRQYQVSVRVNEINYHSAPNYDTGDWIEIYNAGDNAVSLMDWQVRDRFKKFIIYDDILLNPGDYLVICQDTAKFRQFHPDIRNITGNLGYALGNKTGQVRVMDQDNAGPFGPLQRSWPFPAAGRRSRGNNRA
jgi:hypothetical protein